MSYDLRSSRAKVERADKHIKDLETEKAAFLGTNPYVATPEYYPEQDFTVFYCDTFCSTPEIIPLVMGDAIHNLRSSLDHLACALVTDGERSRTYFPICETAEKYESEGLRKIKGLPRQAKDAISLLKPYGGGNDHLWGLHQLDILDKHNLLITAATGVAQMGFRVSAGWLSRTTKGRINFPPSMLPRKTIWVSPKSTLVASKQGDPVLVYGGNYELHQDIELTFDIALCDPEVFKARPVLETLVELRDLVSGIIDSFE